MSSPAPKLTPEQIEEIREKRRQGLACSTIASRYGVSTGFVARLCWGIRPSPRDQLGTWHDVRRQGGRAR